MNDKEFHIGAIIGDKDKGSRWRAIVVPIKVEGKTKAGYIVIRDDEGVRPTNKQLIGLCLDPDAFDLKNGIVVPANPPEFEVMDYALVHEADLIENVGNWKKPKSLFGLV